MIPPRLYVIFKTLSWMRKQRQQRICVKQKSHSRHTAQCLGLWITFEHALKQMRPIQELHKGILQERRRTELTHSICIQTLKAQWKITASLNVNFTLPCVILLQLPGFSQPHQLVVAAALHVSFPQGHSGI